MHESTIKLRLYPNRQQTEFIYQQLGCCRFIWNQLLHFVKTDYENYQNGLREKPVVNRKTLEANLLQLKEEYPFLKTVSSVPLQQTVIDLYRALCDFFDKVRGYPRFKSKSNRGSFRVVNLNMIKFVENKLYLPKNKTPIKTRGNHNGNFPISSYRVVKEPDGRMYGCFTTKVENQKKAPGAHVGIDVGIKSLLTLAEIQPKRDVKITFVKNNRYYIKAQKRLKRLQQSLSRKKKGSQNRQKARIKVAKAHKDVVNKRNDMYHKLTTNITKQFRFITLEDLNIAGMLKNHCLAKHVQDASWYKLTSMLDYKALRRSSCLTYVCRWFPSTQQCSTCGEKSKTKISLKIREWKCEHCHTTHERDANAALNLYLEGKRINEYITVG